MDYIDKITFGSPDVYDAILINTESQYDRLFAQFTAFTFPKNSSPATRDEMNAIQEGLAKLRKDPESVKRFQLYDRNLPDYIAKYLTLYKLDYNETMQFVQSVVGDIKPFVVKLKYFHQRPRPYQLAAHYKHRLFPFRGLFSQTPSFPSLKAVEARVLFEILGNQYPEIYGEMRAMYEDIIYSRVAMGINYQSDVDVGVFVGDTICALPEFKRKYRL